MPVAMLGGGGTDVLDFQQLSLAVPVSGAMAGTTWAGSQLDVKGEQVNAAIVTAGTKDDDEITGMGAGVGRARSRRRLAESRTRGEGGGGSYLGGVRIMLATGLGSG